MHFSFKRNESIRILQVNFGTLDFKHLYDVYRWKFIHTISNTCTYWSEFVRQLDVQFHEALHIPKKYNTFFTNCSVFLHRYIHCECESMC